MPVEFRSIYRRLCPGCGGEIDENRASKGLLCSACLPDIYNQENLKIISHKLEDVFRIKTKLEKVTKLFETLVNNEPWNIQKSWFKRILLGRSFSLVAPTGTGKSTFINVSSIVLALDEKKSLIIVPTVSLVEQVYQNLISYSKRLDASLRILSYHSKIPTKQKSLFKERFLNGDFDIVVVTSNMLKKIFEIKDDTRFDFVFVDDVDSILKSSKNTEFVIRATGFSQEEISKALEFVKTKFSLGVSGSKEKYLHKYNELLGEIDDIKAKDHGIIVVSSATAKPKGAKMKLFVELFDFEIGTKSDTVTNISTYYISTEKYKEKVLDIVKLIGSGGIIFVSLDLGLEFAEELSEYINENCKYKSKVVSSKSIKAILEFREGKVDILIGVSHYYGSLVRGIDIPERIIYSVFVGMPFFKIILDPENVRIPGYQVFKILSEIAGGLENGKEKRKLEAIVRKLRRNLNYAPILEQARSLLRDYLKEDRYIDLLRKSEDIIFSTNNGKNVILIPDMNTFIQASGRTSRVYPGGVSKGICFVIEKNEKLITLSSRRHKWMRDVEWLPFDELSISRDLEIAREDRRKIMEISEGKMKGKVGDIGKTVLIVVESPTKAKTISTLFGKPSKRKIKGLTCYEITTGNMTLMITYSKGHIFELTTDKEDIFGLRNYDGFLVPVYDSIKICNNKKCARRFVSSVQKCPYCGSDDIYDRMSDVLSILEVAKEVDMVLLASDPDTEGEKISFDIFCSLLSTVKHLGVEVKRIEFHEVTYSSVKKAIESPTEINLNLVSAQLFRRIQDRIIGFGLSDFLKDEFEKSNISAGRVQSPVLGWIVKNYEIYNNSKIDYLDITLKSEDSSVSLDLSLEKSKFEALPRSGEIVKVSLVEEKVEERNPLPPFTTDTVLVEANRIFKLGVGETMKILQDLFEEGLITYHRTDSTNVSHVGQNIAKEYLEFVDMQEDFVGRSWSSEGAHECIRPVKSVDSKVLYQLIYEGNYQDLTKVHVMVYDLVFKRFMASQMASALVKNFKYRLSLGNTEVELIRTVSVIKEGWLRFGYIKLDSELPSQLIVQNVRKSKRPSVRLYSQADVIKLMKEKSIGRPSTYSKVINTLITRGYVLDKNNRLIPLPIGIEVYSRLKENFIEFISEEKTAFMESIMDNIEKGTKDYREFVYELYKEYIQISEKVNSISGQRITQR